MGGASVVRQKFVVSSGTFRRFTFPCLPMAPSSPTNLTHSSAYLTDKPYDVQLGVLKWIRCLLSAVIDEATTTAAAAPAAIECKRDQHPHKGADDGVSQEKELLSANFKKVEENEGDRQEQEDVANINGREDRPKILNSAEEAGCAAAAPPSTAGAGTAVGRKRPRTATFHGRSSFGVGCVVECFHPVSDLCNTLPLSRLGFCVTAHAGSWVAAGQRGCNHGPQHYTSLGLCSLPADYSGNRRAAGSAQLLFPFVAGISGMQACGSAVILPMGTVLQFHSSSGHAKLPYHRTYLTIIPLCSNSLSYIRRMTACGIPPQSPP